MDEAKKQIEESRHGTKFDMQRLLQICARLRVGVQRLESGSQQVAIQLCQQRKLIKRTHVKQTNNLRTLLVSWHSYVTYSSLAIGQILRQLSGFSKEVIEYLKKLHRSNMEISALLYRIHEGIPRGPATITADNIHFIDALNQPHSLPFVYFRHWDVFEAMLKLEFKGRPDEKKVIERQYFIMDAQLSGTVIERDNWEESIRPGATLS